MKLDVYNNTAQLQERLEYIGVELENSGIELFPPNNITDKDCGVISERGFAVRQCRRRAPLRTCTRIHFIL